MDCVERPAIQEAEMSTDVLPLGQSLWRTRSHLIFAVWSGKYHYALFTGKRLRNLQVPYQGQTAYIELSACGPHYVSLSLRVQSKHHNETNPKDDFCLRGDVLQMTERRWHTERKEGRVPWAGRWCCYEPTSNPHSALMFPY